MEGYFNKDYIDWTDPFEIDPNNRPHLAKHQPFTEETLEEVLCTDFMLIDLKDHDGPAILAILTEIEKRVIKIPLTYPKSGHLRKIRPIGIYFASLNEVKLYQNETDKRNI